jgi:MFS family permease
MCLFTEIYFLCLWLMSVKLYSPLSAGTYLLAFAAVCIPVSGIVGPIIARVGAYRWAIWIGWVMNTAALGLLNFLDVDTPTFAWILLFVTAGLGQGMLFIAHSIAAQAACQQKDAAHAMAMYSFMRSLGLCFGVALGGAIFQNFLQGQIVRLDLPIEISENAEGYALLLRGMADDSVRSSIMAAYAWAFQRLFTTMCGISGLGMVAAFTLIKGHTLNRTLESEHVLQDEGLHQIVEYEEKTDDFWFGPITL